MCWRKQGNQVCGGQEPSETGVCRARQGGRRLGQQGSKAEYEASMGRAMQGGRTIQGKAGAASVCRGREGN